VGVCGCLSARLHASETRGIDRVANEKFLRLKSTRFPVLEECFDFLAASPVIVAVNSSVAFAEIPVAADN
jgi:hypothetical protein